ncbi:hypothetical protein JJE66_33790 [Bradyrhizobium diazoefficiens]|uniref:hypothetical protein n=1 Tax=Bradyrhizobium diazoefficiens TaxID=1355477 RepID=UPI00190D96F5|nr:hypothetical protein [Bradyrhizobium diazoefficiens]MBK3666181.1 hypothetical protein [Bradyrhizobium diazoefficiens]
MADETTKKDKKTVEVPQAQLTEIMEKLSSLEIANADKDAKIAGLMAATETAAPVGETPLRQKKTFEPAFRVVRLKKIPFNGDPEDKRIVVGWTKRGSYQKVDRSGVAPELVDYMQVIFLGHEKDADGNMQAFEVRTLDLYNAESVVCKIEKESINRHKEPTGEVIPVVIYDPKHGNVLTGEHVDGWTEEFDNTLAISIPGVKDPVVISSKFANICG